jgi:hypothetical protein
MNDDDNPSNKYTAWLFIIGVFVFQYLISSLSFEHSHNPGCYDDNGDYICFVPD